MVSAPATLTPPASPTTTPRADSRAGSELPPDQSTSDGLDALVRGDLPAGQKAPDTHHPGAGGDLLPPDHMAGDARAPVVGGERDLIPSDLDAADALLLILADALDDAERIRIATANRLRALRDDKRLGGTPAEAALENVHDTIARLEHALTLDLQRAMRKHPLGPWVKRTIGIGEKQGARLLAAIGNPADRANPAKLWAYCGFHVIDGKRPRRQKGVKANWSNTAKMRARLIAESCIKQSRSPYRAVYDRERAKWAGRDTTDGHRHNHALAVVAKEVLKDLWREARAVEAPA